MKAVLDSNVLVSAAISPTGAPAELMRRWRSGDFELVASNELLDELERVLRYPKLRRFVDPSDAQALMAALREDALVLDQPSELDSPRSADPDDDFLIALAAGTGSALVSGDRDLLALPEGFPVYSPARFVALLDAP